MDKFKVQHSSGYIFAMWVIEAIFTFLLFLVHPLVGVIFGVYGVFDIIRRKRNVMTFDLNTGLILYNKVGMYASKEITLPAQSLSNVEYVKNGMMGVNIKLIAESGKKYNFKAADK